VDLSQTLEEHMPHVPTHAKFFLFLALLLKICAGSGSPIRARALVWEPAPGSIAACPGIVQRWGRKH